MVHSLRAAARAARSSWRVWLALGVLLALGLVAVVVLPLRDWASALIAGLQGLGGVGIALFAVVYVFAIAVAIPGSVLTMAAGFAWGPGWGFLIVSPVSIVGATLAFLIGRHLLRDRVAAWIAQSSRLQAIDDAVAAHGTVMVMLLRLSPIMPFNVLNYVMGLTRLTPGRYAWASWVGTMPGTFLYAYLGSTLPALGAVTTAGGEAADARAILFWGGLAATLVATVFITRIARRALAARVPLATLQAAPAGGAESAKVEPPGPIA